MNLRLPHPAHDERITAVGNASYGWAYSVLSLGLLVHVMLGRSSHPWDVMGLLVVGGLVSMAYQVRMRTFPWRWHLGLWLAFIAPLLILAYAIITFMLR